MKLKPKKIKVRDIPVYEHLEYALKHTTYADRLQWLEEANAFVHSLKKKKIIKPAL